MGFLAKTKRRIAIAFIILVALSSVPAISYAETAQVTIDTTTILTAAEYERIAKEAEEKAARTNDPVDIENARKARETADAANGKAQDASANISAQGGGVAGSAGSCGLTNLVTDGLAQCIVKVVGSAILALANFLLGIAGTLLNWVVVKTVFQFGNTIGNSPGVLIAWGIFRDIGNLILLFGFIFMGIATILNTNTFSAKRALPSLIIFAVLMNFSLFAAEAIIDGTNAVTSVMYAQANTDACLGGSSEGPVQAQGSGSQIDNGGSGSLSDCAINYGLAGHIMQSTGLSTMWQTNGSFSAEFFTYVGLALFATIGAVVMIAASIMLVIRLVVLTFVMVAAPIGFAGFAIPPMRGFAKQWWDKLISQAIFAPVLFLLILVSLKITDSFSGSYGDRGLAGALTQPNASVMGIVMIFVIVIGFLVASLMAARSLGAQGASFAINTATRGVRGVYGGIGGVAGRNTIGKGGQFAQKKYETWMGKEPSGRAGKAARSILRSAGIDRAIANTTKAAQTARFGSSESIKEKQDRVKARTEELKKAGRKATNEQTINNAANDSEAARALSKMSETEIAELDAVKKGTAKLDLIAKNLSPEAFERIMNNKDVSSDVKGKLTDKRFASLKDAIANGREGEVRKWSAKDLESLAKYDTQSFENLINGQTANGDSLLSTDQFDTLQKSNALSNAQKQLVRDESRGGRIGKLLDRSNGNQPTIQQVQQAQTLINSIGGAKNVAKLPANVLTDPAIANNLSVAQLAAIVTEDKLNQQQQHDLAVIVRARAANDPAIANYINPATNPIAAAYYTP